MIGLSTVHLVLLNAESETCAEISCEYLHARHNDAPIGSSSGRICSHFGT